MRFYVAGIAILVLAPALGAQRTVDERHAVSPRASIRLTSVSQTTELRVIGWEKDSMALTGTVSAGARVDGGVASNGGGAKWFVEVPQGRGQEPVQLELRVPVRSRVWVKLGAGEVEVTGMHGAIDVNIVSGSITVTGDLAELNAEAMDGTISVNGRADWLRAKTAGGSIEISGGGSDLGMTSVSGDVRLRGSGIARARIETVTGNVIVAPGLERGGQLTIDTHSGRVEVRLSPKQGTDIDVATVNGTVTNQLTAARPQPGMGARGQELGTSIAGGGRSITIRTFKGPVLLAGDTATSAVARP
jgi:lipopolysaccharide export system protein LptA